MQAEAQMHLGCGLASPVFGPVHAVGRRLGGRRIDHADSDIEAPQQPFAPASQGERRPSVLRVGEVGPEESPMKSASRSLIGWERVLRAGVVTPKGEMAPHLSRSQSNAP